MGYSERNLQFEMKKYVSKGRRVLENLQCGSFTTHLPIFHEALTCTPPLHVRMHLHFENSKSAKKHTMHLEFGNGSSQAPQAVEEIHPLTLIKSYIHPLSL